MEICSSISNMTKHSMWSSLYPRQIKPTMVNRLSIHSRFAGYLFNQPRELSEVFSDATTREFKTNSLFHC